MKTIRIEISGKVQGVFFRATAKEIAQAHNVSGWAKNTSDGKVVMVATGEENDLEELISWCKKGPEKAKVNEAVVIDMPLQKFNKFEVIR